MHARLFLFSRKAHKEGIHETSTVHNEFTPRFSRSTQRMHTQNFNSPQPSHPTGFQKLNNELTSRTSTIANRVTQMHHQRHIRRDANTFAPIRKRRVSLSSCVRLLEIVPCRTVPRAGGSLVWLSLSLLLLPFPQHNPLFFLCSFISDVCNIGVFWIWIRSGYFRVFHWSQLATSQTKVKTHSHACP